MGSCALLVLVALSGCAGPEVVPPIERVSDGYVVHLEKNPLDTGRVNGRLVDLVVMDMAPLASATSSADTAAFVNAVMNEDKHVVKVTGVASMTGPFLLHVRTEKTMDYDATHDQVLFVDLHDTTNTAQHPNLRGTLGCGSCMLLNQFRKIHTACLTGGRKRCATCISCELVPR